MSDGQFASFYSSPAWKRCRAALVKERGGLCELCLKRGIYTPGKIVHHKVELTAENINDINITLNHDNLLLVCQECHNAIHLEGKRPYKVDASGNLTERIRPPMV